MRELLPPLLLAIGLLVLAETDAQAQDTPGHCLEHPDDLRCRYLDCRVDRDLAREQLAAAVQVEGQLRARAESCERALPAARQAQEDAERRTGRALGVGLGVGAVAGIGLTLSTVALVGRALEGQRRTTMLMVGGRW